MQSLYVGKTSNQIILLKSPIHILYIVTQSFSTHIAAQFKTAWG